MRRNYRMLCETVRAQNTSTRVLAVVKADAYGHGAPACVRALLQEGCDFFAVSRLEEAEAVRAVCDGENASADILILGFTPPVLAARLAQKDLIQTLLSEDYARQLNATAAEAGVSVRTHVAVDTGMNRIGFAAHTEQEAQASKVAIARVCRLPHLRTEGMFTHFARADEALQEDGLAYTDLQAARYRRVRELLETDGICIPFHHVCNSAASLLRPADHMDGVRLGIVLYGSCPVGMPCLPPESVLKLKTKIVHLHRLLPGESVSYGGIFRADTERLLATLPLGYGDGLLRAYTGATVTVETAQGPRSAPIVGRICMDQCMIDVTDLDAQTDDTVTLFGNQPQELADYAARAGTIDYECLCLISARVPRKYVE